MCTACMTAHGDHISHAGAAVTTATLVGTGVTVLLRSLAASSASRPSLHLAPETPSSQQLPPALLTAEPAAREQGSGPMRSFPFSPELDDLMAQASAALDGLLGDEMKADGVEWVRTVVIISVGIVSTALVSSTATAASLATTGDRQHAAAAPTDVATAVLYCAAHAIA